MFQICGQLAGYASENKKSLNFNDDKEFKRIKSDYWKIFHIIYGDLWCGKII